MFGKPEWFDENNSGWGLSPKSWQGWAYTVIWAGVLVAPSSLLLSQFKLPETGIWLIASASFLLYDLCSTKRKMRAQKDLDNLYYISEESVAPPVSTDNFDLHVKN